MLQFTLNGRLVADPNITTYGTDHKLMARIRIASNQPGRTSTDFFDVAIFGPAVNQLTDARKGDTVKVSGHATHNVWHDDSGDRHETIGLVAGQVLEHRPRTSSTAAAVAEQTAHQQHHTAASAVRGR